MNAPDPTLGNPRPGLNKQGTPVTIFDCIVCGHEVSVCPAVPPEDFERLWGGECTGDLCPSYDLARDVSIFFEPMAEVGLIVRDTPWDGAR